jgi:hypothetical protein
LPFSVLDRIVEAPDALEARLDGLIEATGEDAPLAALRDSESEVAGVSGLLDYDVF